MRAIGFEAGEERRTYAHVVKAVGLDAGEEHRLTWAREKPDRAERLSRDLMLLIGNSYYDAIVQSDGNASPFADDCERRENGMRTAGPGGTVTQGCRGQLTSRAMSYIQSIDLRPVWIADEETGLVFGLTMFRHPMEEKFVTLLNPDGTTTQRPMNFNSFDCPSLCTRTEKVFESPLPSTRSGRKPLRSGLRYAV